LVTETEARSAFGMRLRAARKRAGLSMEELAGRMGGVVTKQAIGKYETGPDDAGAGCARDVGRGIGTRRRIRFRIHIRIGIRGGGCGTIRRKTSR
jgi:Helix-turn-helix.